MGIMDKADDMMDKGKEKLQSTDMDEKAEAKLKDMRRDHKDGQTDQMTTDNQGSDL